MHGQHTTVSSCLKVFHMGKRDHLSQLKMLMNIVEWKIHKSHSCKSDPLLINEAWRLISRTPTVMAGDGSNLAVIAHELSHSWSGNLVTCAGWSHFWLNEGELDVINFDTY